MNNLELNHLTETERDQILNVLRRDDDLRTKEQDRIRKLRTDVKRLRLRGVIREGQDADKTCARCRQSFGWIFNKGSLCPNCQHRVCDKCREKDKDGWLCVLCFKQMELEAMTNHWFYSKFRKSKRNKKTNQVVSGTELIRTSFRRPVKFAREGRKDNLQKGTTLASNSLTEEVKKALYNNNSTPKSPRSARSPHDGETSDTQSMEGVPLSRRGENAAFPQDEDKQLLMELIKPRRHNGPVLDQQHVQVKRVTSNRFKDSDSDSDSAPSSPPLSSRNESMFTHTDSLRSSLRSSSAVSSDGRITIVTDMGGVSDMELASVDIPMHPSPTPSRRKRTEMYVNDPHGFGAGSPISERSTTRGSRSPRVSSTPASLDHAKASPTRSDGNSVAYRGIIHDNQSASSDSDNEYTKDSLSKMKLKKAAAAGAKSKTPSPESMMNNNRLKDPSTNDCHLDSDDDRTPPSTPIPHPNHQTQDQAEQNHENNRNLDHENLDIASGDALTSSVKNGPTAAYTMKSDAPVVNTAVINANSKGLGNNMSSFPTISHSSSELVRNQVGTRGVRHSESHGGGMLPCNSSDVEILHQKTEICTDVHSTEKQNQYYHKRSQNGRGNIPQITVSASSTTHSSVNGDAPHDTVSELSQLGPQQRFNPFLKSNDAVGDEPFNYMLKQLSHGGHPDDPQEVAHHHDKSFDDLAWDGDVLAAGASSSRAILSAQSGDLGLHDQEHMNSTDSHLQDLEREQALEFLRNNLKGLGFPESLKVEPLADDSVPPEGHSSPVLDIEVSEDHVAQMLSDGQQKYSPTSQEYQSYVAEALAAMRRARYGRLLPPSEDDDDSLSVISEKTEPFGSDYNSTSEETVQDSCDELSDLEIMTSVKQSVRTAAGGKNRVPFALEDSSKITVTTVRGIPHLDPVNVKDINQNLPYKPYHSSENLPKTMLPAGDANSSHLSEPSETESAQDDSPTSTLSSKSKPQGKMLFVDTTESAEEREDEDPQMDKQNDDLEDLDSLDALARNQSTDKVLVTDLDLNDEDSDDELDSLIETNKKYVTASEMKAIILSTSYERGGTSKRRQLPKPVQKAPISKAIKESIERFEAPKNPTKSVVGKAHLLTPPPATPPQTNRNSSGIGRREDSRHDEFVDRSPTASVSDLKSRFNIMPGYMKIPTINTSTPIDSESSPRGLVDDIQDTPTSRYTVKELSPVINPSPVLCIASEVPFKPETDYYSLTDESSSIDEPHKQNDPVVTESEAAKAAGDWKQVDEYIQDMMTNKQETISMEADITSKRGGSPIEQNSDNKIQKIDTDTEQPDMERSAVNSTKTLRKKDPVYENIPYDPEHVDMTAECMASSTLSDAKNPTAMEGEEGLDLNRTSSYEEIYSTTQDDTDQDPKSEATVIPISLEPEEDPGDLSNTESLQAEPILESIPDKPKVEIVKSQSSAPLASENSQPPLPITKTEKAKKPRFKLAALGAAFTPHKKSDKKSDKLPGGEARYEEVSVQHIKGDKDPAPSLAEPVERLPSADNPGDHEYANIDELALQHTEGVSKGGRSPAELEPQETQADHQHDDDNEQVSVANGRLAPPRSRDQNDVDPGQDRLSAVAASDKLPPSRTPPSERMRRQRDNVASKRTAVPSIALAADNVSQSSRPSEDENIDELFASHASMTSYTESNVTKHSSNLLSPFSTSRESIASFYSDAGEGNYGIPVTGDILFGLDYNYKNNIFEVSIKMCRDLAPVDVKRKRSDPYIKTYLLPDKTKNGKRKTRVKKHTLNPTYDETLKYHITKSELENRTLAISVWHNDTFGRNNFLGEVSVPMDDYSFSNSSPKWHQLMERHANPMAKLAYKGDLVISLKFVTSDHLLTKKRGRAGERGELHVLIKEAQNLMAVRSNGSSDPFCKGYLLPEKTKSSKQKTAVKKRDCNPKWNHTFVFEDIALADLKEKCLELTVWDHDRFTTNDFLGGVRLSLGVGTSGGREVDWMDSKGEEISMWQSMLDRPNCWIEGTLLLRPSMDRRL